MILGRQGYLGICINYLNICFDSMITLQKMSKLESDGSLINWNNVWKCYPFNIIDISPVFKAKAENEYV